MGVRIPQGANPELLLAIRKPHEHRSLIVFAAAYSFFHALVMTIETVESCNHGVRRDYGDVIVAIVLGLLLLVAIPAREKAALA